MAKSGNVSTALEFDVGAWRQGVRDAAQILSTGLTEEQLKPLNDALNKVEKKVEKEIAEAKASATNAAKSAGAAVEKEIGGATVKASDLLKGSFAGLGSMVRGLVPAVGAYSVVSYLRDATREADRFEDSVAVLRRTLNATLDRPAALAAEKSLGELTRNTSIVLGADPAEVNDTLSTFLARNHSLEEARRLTLLAVDMSERTGNSLKEVSKSLADAADGSADAIKSLRADIKVTGDRAKDGQAAIAKLSSLYGGAARELVSDSDKLSASWRDLKVAIGSELLPLSAPLLTWMADSTRGVASLTRELKELAGATNQPVEPPQQVRSREDIHAGLESLGVKVEKPDALDLEMARLGKRVGEGIDKVTARSKWDRGVFAALGQTEREKAEEALAKDVARLMVKGDAQAMVNVPEAVRQQLGAMFDGAPTFDEERARMASLTRANLEAQAAHGDRFAREMLGGGGSESTAGVASAAARAAARRQELRGRSTPEGQMLWNMANFERDQYLFENPEAFQAAYAKAGSVRRQQLKQGRDLYEGKKWREERGILDPERDARFVLHFMNTAPDRWRYVTQRRR